MPSTMTCTSLVFLEEIPFICHKNQYPHREREENEQPFSHFPSAIRPLPDLWLSKAAWIPTTDSSHRIMSPIAPIACPSSRSAQWWFGNLMTRDTNWVISFRKEVSGQQVENYRLPYFNLYSSWKGLLLWYNTSQLTSELRRNPWKDPGSVESCLLSNLSQRLMRTARHSRLFLILFCKLSSFFRPAKTGADAHLPQIYWNCVCTC